MALWCCVVVCSPTVVYTEDSREDLSWAWLTQVMLKTHAMTYSSHAQDSRHDLLKSCPRLTPWLTQVIPKTHAMTYSSHAQDSRHDLLKSCPRLTSWLTQVMLKTQAMTYSSHAQHLLESWLKTQEKTLESPLDCKEIQPVNPQGNQSWIFIGRTDAAAETPILWLPNAKK